MRRILDSLPCVILRADIRAFFEGLLLRSVFMQDLVVVMIRENTSPHLGLTLAEHTSYHFASLPSSHEL
jgi:hypothetical protein